MKDKSLENNKIDEILEKKVEITPESVILALDSARNVSNLASMDLPEQIALSFDWILKELQEFIEKHRENKELERAWALYRESLKVKFALMDDKTMKEVQNGYNLGLDAKSIPEFGFYFGESSTANKVLENMIYQTQLQREKNLKEAKSMGIDVMSTAEEEIFSELMEGFDD